MLLLISLLCCLINLHAQGKNNIKLGIEAGGFPLSDSENLKLFLNLEPKLKVSENIFIGLRIGVILNTQSIENYDDTQFSIDEKSDNGGVSFVPSVDYYLNESKLRPYLGLGIGAYLLTKYIDVFEYPSLNRIEVDVNNQLGFLLRGGFESDKLRFGVEYNLISKADIEMPSGQTIGKVDNSYFGLSIGFIFGFGNNSK